MRLWSSEVRLPVAAEGVKSRRLVVVDGDAVVWSKDMPVTTTNCTAVYAQNQTIVLLDNETPIAGKQILKSKKPEGPICLETATAGPPTPPPGPPPADKPEASPAATATSPELTQQQTLPPNSTPPENPSA